jgi:hypothetical protein
MLPFVTNANGSPSSHGFPHCIKASINSLVAHKVDMRGNLKKRISSDARKLIRVTLSLVVTLYYVN